MTAPVIPRAAIEATTEASYAHRDASGPYGAVKCRCGERFRTGVEQLQHASQSILQAVIPHLHPLFGVATGWAPGTDEHLAEAKRQMEVAIKMAPILDEHMKEARELGRQEAAEEIAAKLEPLRDQANDAIWQDGDPSIAMVARVGAFDNAIQIARDTGKGDSARPTCKCPVELCRCGHGKAVTP